MKPRFSDRESLKKDYSNYYRKSYNKVTKHHLKAWVMRTPGMCDRSYTPQALFKSLG